MPTITHKAVMDIFGIPNQRAFDRFKESCDNIVEDNFSITTSASRQPESIEAAIQAIALRHPLLRIDLANNAHKSAARRFVMSIHGRHRSNLHSRSRNTGSQTSTRSKAMADTTFKPHRATRNASKVPAPQPPRRVRMRAPITISDSDSEDEPEFFIRRRTQPVASSSSSSSRPLNGVLARASGHVSQPGPQDGISAVTDFLDAGLRLHLAAFINFGFTSEMELLAVAQGRPGSIDGVVNDFEMYCNAKNIPGSQPFTLLHKSLLRSAFESLR
ncbi:hypothetical protein BKA70DRAFT_1277760 [Coprinopsis sp. MPI-PUGE-AT-0042]|nr:hypothetical protein BKA70DRAFT_1277760 [Coprinopsis sp. MPI-PUGE-AT-0042]